MFAFNNRQFYPDELILSANVTNENMQAGMDYLLSGAAKPGCKIRLNDNLITPLQLDILLKALADERCPEGVEIFFDDCQFTDGYANKFAILFDAGQYPANMRLHFNRNSIGDNGLFSMLDALSRPQNRKGVFLDMQHNPHITDQCIDAITTLIAHDQLAEGVGIDLRNNPNLSSANLLQLARSVEQNTAVTELLLNLTSYDFNTDMMADNEIVMMVTSLENERQSKLYFCCERNRLLQKYRDNPDFLCQIYRLTAKRGFPLPWAPVEKNALPTLRFFAATTLPPADLRAFFYNNPAGYEGLRDLNNGVQDILETLEPGSTNRGCPWSCNIL